MPMGEAEDRDSCVT